MITCRDINNLRLDGVDLLTGEAGLERMVSWTYIVQTKPYKDHMNPGNFALLVVDFAAIFNRGCIHCNARAERAWNIRTCNLS